MVTVRDHHSWQLHGNHCLTRGPSGYIAAYATCTPLFAGGVHALLRSYPPRGTAPHTVLCFEHVVSYCYVNGAFCGSSWCRPRDESDGAPGHPQACV